MSSNRHPNPAVLHAMVTACAHGLWENEGRPNGRALLHWARAEDMFAPLVTTPSHVERKVHSGAARFSVYGGPMLGGSYRLTARLSAASRSDDAPATIVFQSCPSRQFALV